MLEDLIKDVMTFWGTLITLGYLSHHSILDINCHLRGTECRASANRLCNMPFYPKSHHPKCRLRVGEAHTNVCMYTYIIYWMASSSTILVFIALLLSAYFRLDLLLTRLSGKKKYWHFSVLYLTFLVVLLVISFQAVTLSELAHPKQTSKQKTKIK